MGGNFPSFFIYSFKNVIVFLSDGYPDPISPYTFLSSSILASRLTLAMIEAAETMG
jgi:hypothetical protein